MPRGPSPERLPDTLSGPFTTEDARTAGLSRGRTRAADLDRRIHGVRDAAGASDDFEKRCRMFERRLGPDVFFSHATAARLMGAPLPWSLEEDTRLHVSVAAPHRAPHARGLIGHSMRVEEHDVRTTRGLRHSSPARAWCELASQLSIPDLVAVGDHLIHHRAPWMTRDELAQRLAVSDRLTRSRRLGWAYELLDERAESRPESRLRVILKWSGLPLPAVNHVVVQAAEGHGIRTDFAFPELRVAIEYQGDYHRNRAQWRADMTRRTRLEARGWYVLEVNEDDLADPDELVSRTRRLLARRPSVARNG